MGGSEFFRTLLFEQMNENNEKSGILFPVQFSNSLRGVLLLVLNLTEK